MEDNFIYSIFLFEHKIFDIVNANISHKFCQKCEFFHKKGEHIAIVGKNGAGKTTMIKLLLRLYAPTHGKIFINGADITEYNLSSLRRVASVLFQDYSIYAFSVRENLRFNYNSHNL